MTNEIQNAIVLVIVALAGAYVFWNLFGGLFTRRKRGACGGCHGCGSEKTATTPAAGFVPLESLTKRDSV